jgi:hypothetical protein
MTHNPDKRIFGEVHYIDENDASWIIDSILKEKTILKFIKFFNLRVDASRYIDIMASVKTVSELQRDVLAPIFAQIFDNTTDGLSCSNIEAVTRDKGAVFVSNHRDIVLDSAAMNMMLFRNGFQFANAGIGDNLLMNSAVQIIFNMMKCFVIKRSLPIKQQVVFLRDLSEFIDYCVTEKGESIWIAQASGRAKDGDDCTNPAILKMLAMSNRNDAIEQLSALNLHTTACSYEWDPCDVFKVAELLVKKQGKTYTKKPNEDMISIHAGICEPKGRIHVSFDRLSDDALLACRDMNERERFQKLAVAVDVLIRKGYRLFPSNYIAADLLSGTDEHAGNYSAEDKEYFIDRMELRLSRFEDAAAAPARRLFLTIYANPLFNKNPVTDRID